MSDKGGVKFAVAWLHKRAAEMNDPHAKAILNSAAFSLGQANAGGKLVAYPEATPPKGQAEAVAACLQICRDEAAKVADTNADRYWQSKRIEGAIRSALASPAPAGRGVEVKTLDEWHEDDGFAVWWTLKNGDWLGEPSYIGSPLCDDWPGYHTHWTPHPEFPAAPIPEGE